MLVVGATEEQVRKAAKAAGIRPYNVRTTRRGVTLRLRVLTRYRLRDSTARDACWHGHRRFMLELRAANTDLRQVIVGNCFIDLTGQSKTVGAQCRSVFGGGRECTCKGRNDPPPQPVPRLEERRMIFDTDSPQALEFLQRYAYQPVFNPWARVVLRNGD